MTFEKPHLVDRMIQRDQAFLANDSEISVVERKLRKIQGIISATA
jgi:hypothetical protein